MAERLARLSRYRGAITALVAVFLVALGLAALDRLTREIHYADVRAVIHGLPSWRLALALGFTALSYLALTFYDVLALRIIGRPLPWRTAALASFTSYTLSHNLGLALLTGGSARYRVYSAAGLDGPDIARIIGIASAAFWAGVATVAGAALLLHEGALVLPALTLSESLSHGLGLATLLVVGGLIAASVRVRGPLRLAGMTLPLPRLNHAMGMLVISILDLVTASAALFVLIPAAAPTLLPAFVLAYALGIVASAVTHVPGGIGIFEAIVMSVLPGDPAVLLAALVVYRIVYYVLPLAAAILLLAVKEGFRERTAVRRLSHAPAIISQVAPVVLGTATFCGGVVLLLSDALPALGYRTRVLARFMPLPFIEASHIAASLVGTALLLLVPGLYRRLDAANLAARVLLLAGAVFSLVKGIDYEEAIVCLTIAGLLHWTRGAFYRKTALTAAPLPASWSACVAIALAVAAWTGFFAFRRIPYSDALWWQFAVHDDAPRFLRAMLAVAVMLAAIAVWRAFAPAPSSAVPVRSPGREALDAALACADRTDAMLALTGDKRFLWSDDGTAFVMYQIAGSSWVVMGDPVGPRDAWPDLLWQLREKADAAQGRLLLYELSAPALELAIGMGLQIIKYGEEAIVDLTDFTLATPQRRSVRRAAQAAANKGATFRILPAAEVPAMLDTLQAVSDSWMGEKGRREKGFSLGRFDRDYLVNFDIALVMLGDEVIAFANLWLTANRNEASVDLMRQRADVPPGTMDFLFTQIMLWAQAEGYRRFSLGMAPLSGIADRRLAPAWARMSAFVFRHGERLYGFRGLRTYKEKYAPSWEARYIAGPRGLALAGAMHDLSRLIGGRVRRLRHASVPPPMPPRVPDPSLSDTVPPPIKRGIGRPPLAMVL